MKVQRIYLNRNNVGQKVKHKSKQKNYNIAYYIEQNRSDGPVVRASASQPEGRGARAPAESYQRL